MKPFEETYRPLMLPNRMRKFVLVGWCKCDSRRGPLGGVCGNCGDAIPSQRELDAGAPNGVESNIPLGS